MKTICITWWASWLWKEIAKQCVEKWYTVVLVDKDLWKLQKTAWALWITKYVLCDISQKSQVIWILPAIKQMNVLVDVLINNAGIRTDNELDNLHSDNQVRVMETNALGNMWVSDVFLEYFKEKKAWHIINIVSTSALGDHIAGDNSNWRYYGASKWAFNGYIQSIKNECSSYGIKISAVYPWWFESDLYETAWRENAHHQPRMMQTSSVANAVGYIIDAPQEVVIDKLVITKFF